MSRTCPFCERDNTEVHNDGATPDDIYHWYCTDCEEVIS
jgi:transposase-like protein